MEVLVDTSIWSLALMRNKRMNLDNTLSTMQNTFPSLFTNR